MNHGTSQGGPEAGAAHPASRTRSKALSKTRSKTLAAICGPLFDMFLGVTGVSSVPGSKSQEEVGRQHQPTSVLWRTISQRTTTHRHLLEDGIINIRANLPIHNETVTQLE